MYDVSDVRALFEPVQGIYLDSATYGLPPRATAEAMRHAIDAWQAGTADWVHDWDEKGEDCRAAFASLIGAASSTVALVPTVSVGVGMIAATLDASDDVVVPDDEFTSVLGPLLVAQRERGVRVRTVPLDNLAPNVTPGTTLVAFSLIQSQGGRAAALRDVVEAAQNVGARTLVDATHAVPFVSVKDEIERIDYLVCAAYKHLLSPRGVGFLSIKQSLWDAIPPILANWRSAAHPYGNHYGPDVPQAPGAARYDVSLAWFSWLGASVSLQLLAEWQREGILDEPVKLARILARRLGLPVEPVGTVLSVPVADAEGVRRHLQEAGIKAAVRAGSVRLSTHVYNTRDEVERAADVVAPFVRVAATT
jgi:selenocysteine lyase/cysteine desulfurase